MKKVYLSILLFILLLMPINSKALTNISYADTSCPILTEANAWTSTINGVKTLLDNIGIVTTYNTYGSRWHGYLDMSPTVQYKKNKTGLNSGF